MVDLRASLLPSNLNVPKGKHFFINVKKATLRVSDERVIFFILPDDLFLLKCLSICHPVMRRSQQALPLLSNLLIHLNPK